jgi:hypothetical protein
MRVRTSAKVAAAAALGAVALSAPAAARPVWQEPATGPSIDRLRETLLRPGELKGFIPLDCPTVRTDAVEQAGFVAGLREPLAADGALGENVAAEFRTRAAASAEAARTLGAASGATYAVAGIPGAHGYTTFAGNGYGVVFTVGAREYELHVEYAFTQSSKRAAVAAAARIVYHRALA